MLTRARLRALFTSVHGEGVRRMLQSHQIEELICLVASLDRDALIDQFANYRASFPIDFTTEFLHEQSLDRLRHIFVALCLHCQRLPNTAAVDIAAVPAA